MNSVLYFCKVLLCFRLHWR